MWEICVMASRKGRHLIVYIEEKMRPVVKELHGIMSMRDTESSSSVAIGCTEENRAKLEGVLRFVLCDVFCEKMKYDYLFDNIEMIPRDSGFFDAFVKVCTYFDNELERQIVLRTLKFDKQLMLESYLNFRLRALKLKWDELCKLTNDNAMLFLQSETFLELLKFLLSNIAQKCDCVVITFEDKCMLYKEEQNMMENIDSLDPCDDMGLLSRLIDLSPAKIKIFNKPEYTPMTNLLCELFEGRVELI